MAVVTGSGRGLGRAYAAALAQAGAVVVVNDVDDAAPRARRVEAIGGRASPRSARSATPRPPTRWWRAPSPSSAAST